MPPIDRATPRHAARRLALAALLLCGAAARAQVPNVPPAADPRLYAPPSTNQGATAFACSVETLVSGAGCILESDAAAATDVKAQARDNQALAASLSGWACAFAARAPGEPAPDREVLSRLIGGAWDKDLQTRPEASVLLARVVANRGGDLDGDLAAIRKQRVPLFPVGPALSHPDLYKGRLVLLRAEVRDVKLGKGKEVTTRLAEFGLGATSKFVDEDTRSVERSTGSAAFSDSGGYRGNLRGESETQYITQKRLTGNELNETGVEVVGRMAEVDPFFEPGRQFVVLGRFDGARKEPSEDPENPRQVALISIVAYFEPSHSIIE